MEDLSKTRFGTHPFNDSDNAIVNVVMLKVLQKMSNFYTDPIFTEMK